MTTLTNGVNGSSSVASANLNNIDDKNASIQLLFAQLQLELAKSNKASAFNKISTIKNQQTISKAFTNAINALRTKKNSMGDDKISRDDLVELIKKSGKFDIDDKKEKDVLAESGIDIANKEHKAADLDLVIQQLTDYQNTVNSDVQQQMIFVSDFMGQYNAFLQGANTQVSKNADTLTSIVRS